jgi:hypothetical protein
MVMGLVILRLSERTEAVTVRDHLAHRRPTYL